MCLKLLTISLISLLTYIYIKILRTACKHLIRLEGYSTPRQLRSWSRPWPTRILALVPFDRIFHIGSPLHSMSWIRLCACLIGTASLRCSGLIPVLSYLEKENKPFLYRYSITSGTSSLNFELHNVKKNNQKQNKIGV